MRILSRFFIDGFYSLLDPVGAFLKSAHVHPHVVTVAGFILSALTALLFWHGHIFLGGVTLVLAGACDALDGRLARSTNQSSRFGALLDSVMDRYSEIVVLIGLAAFFSTPFMSAMIILAITGSLLTSYIRARAEAVGIECKMGLMQRPERVTFIATGAIIGALFDLVFGTHQPLLKLAIVAIALFGNYTVIERVVHIRRQLDEEIEKE